MPILVLIDYGFVLYNLISSGFIAWNLYKQRDYYLKKGQSEAEADALAVQDEGAEIGLQLAKFPGEKLLIKITNEVLKDVIIELTHRLMKSGKIKNAIIEIEKTIYKEVKDILNNFPNVYVVEKITISKEVQDIIDAYQEEEKNNQQQNQTPTNPTSLPPVPPSALPPVSTPQNPTQGPISHLKDIFIKGKELNDSIDNHNRLTSEELGKRIANPDSTPETIKTTPEHFKQAKELFEKIYNPQTPADEKMMLDDLSKIQGLKNISEQELTRVITTKGKEILGTNTPPQKLQDVLGDIVDELINSDTSIEKGKQLAKTVTISPLSIPQDSGLKLQPSSTNPTSPDNLSNTDITSSNEGVFTRLVNKFIGWLEKYGKEKGLNYLLSLLQDKFPSPTPEGGGQVHVNGYERNGHPVKAYDRSRPSI
jgi:hypothetical protein